MYTILVADDEEELRRAIIRKIDWESIGFRVVGEAENGVEALELVERMEPDLLLTDIRMPFLSGIELARQVREVRPTTQIAFLSGHDDFSYAQQAIQYNIISYMLKPITMADLSDELAAIKVRLDGIFEEFRSRAKEQTDVYGFVTPLLLDAYGSPDEEGREEELVNQAIRAGLLKDANNSFVYVVTAASMWDEEGRNVTSSNMVHSVDTILQKYVKFCSFYMEGRIISLLIATKSTFERYLHILVGDVLQSMERILGLKCRMGVSRTEARLVGCHEAYSEAMNALSYSKGGDSSVHYISDEEREEDWDTAGIEERIVDMENLIRGGSKEELDRYLADLFEELGGEREGNTQTRFLLIQLFSAVCRIVYAVADKEAVRELQDISFMQSAVSFDTSAPQIADKFSSFCQTARDMVRSGRKKSSQVLCDQTLFIIEKDFSNPDLSLVGVSAQINVSPNYLSALVKKQTGVSFVDMLTKKRMDTARELLSGTSMKIREISEKCGYNDQHYFSYCFKKYWGESPNSFRQQLQG